MEWGKTVCKGIKQKRFFIQLKGCIKESCRPIFKELKAVTVTAIHIFEVLIYTRTTHI